MNEEIPKGYYRISAKALVFDEKRSKFLLVRSDSGHWDLPGGGIVWGETPEECIRREIREEMGLEISHLSASPAYFFTLANEKVKYAYVVYELTLQTLDFTPSDECREIRFVSTNEARELPLRPNVGAFLDLYR